MEEKALLRMGKKTRYPFLSLQISLNSVEVDQQEQEKAFACQKTLPSRADATL